MEGITGEREHLSRSEHPLELSSIIAHHDDVTIKPVDVFCDGVKGEIPGDKVLLNPLQPRAVEPHPEKGLCGVMWCVVMVWCGVW